jgi:hypothetical protein
MQTIRPKSTTVSQEAVIGECARASAEVLERLEATCTAEYT